MRARGNLLQRRPANSCARNSITFGKANTGRGRRSRRLPLACPRRGARESSCGRRRAGKPRTACAGRLAGTLSAGATAMVTSSPAADPARSPARFSTRGGTRPRDGRFPGRLTRRRGGGRRLNARSRRIGPCGRRDRLGFPRRRGAAHVRGSQSKTRLDLSEGNAIEARTRRKRRGRAWRNPGLALTKG